MTTMTGAPASPDVVADWGDPSVRELVRRLDYVVVSPDYRLAPEHPFPAAFDDCLAVANFVLREHSRLKVNPSKVAVSGDSAGGNLAAAVAARLKKRLRMQILIYPFLQAFDFAAPSYVDNAETFVIGRDLAVLAALVYGNLSLAYAPAFQSSSHLDLDIRSKYERLVHSDLLPAHLNVTNRTSRQSAFGDSAVSDAVRHVVLNPSFMPLMADSLDDYPDAYIVTGQYDVLRDDGLMYATRLSLAKNVKVKLQHYDHGFHAFFHFVDGPLATTIARVAMEDLVEFLKEFL